MGLRRSLQLSGAVGARGAVPLLLMLASGFAGLGYQIVWTQQCGMWLGHESAAVLAVVAAFFGGLSLGALRLGPRIDRSPRPARWYAGCELAIALWALMLALIVPSYGDWALRVTGARPAPLWQWSVAFLSTFVLLLPATAAMGATLPAMQRITSELQRTQRYVAALYASNTLGAVLGVVVSASFLIARFGLMRTSFVCAALNLLCGLGALFAFPTSIAPAAPIEATKPARRVLATLTITGLLGIGYEVLVVRVLSQVTEDTVYTFAALLAVYLLGSAAGAAAYQRWLVPRYQAKPLGDWLLAAAGAACLLGALTLWVADATKSAAQSAFGDSTNRAILAEAVPALLAFGLPTFVMGALFSQLCERAQTRGISFGRALGYNTLGASIAPALFGVLLAPTLGPKLALLATPLGYLALCSRRAWPRLQVVVPTAATLGAGLLLPRLAFVEVPEGGRIVSYEDGMMAAVSVVEDSSGVSRLRINNRAQEGSSATQRVDGRQAWLPLLLHRAPRHALFLGLGTGVTASMASRDDTLHVDAVELLPEVIRAAPYFAQSVADGSALPRLRLTAADARRYVRSSPEHYDLVVADNFHPARSGSGALYTVEHFAAVRDRLEPHGIFCQWLPLHQLDNETLRSIVRSFLAAYPRGWALIASGSLETPVLGLIGRRDGQRFDISETRKRLEQVALPDVVSGLGFEDELALLGSFVAGPHSLQRFAANAPLNTDDDTVVTYSAPRITYAPDSSPAERFIALLAELSIAPSELISNTDNRWTERLGAYFVARNRFIESGRHIHPSPRVEEMLAQVREPLLAVLRISPDFRPAYDPLLSMAGALARSNVADARRLLLDLSQLQPARRDATELLAMLAGAPSSNGTNAH